MEKRRQASRSVVKVKRALGQQPANVQARRQAFDADVSEAFRRARSSIDQITTDFRQLQRRATSVVKGSQRPAKLK